MKPLCIKQSNIPYVEARMNSKAAQLRENGTEIVRLFARFALGASFLSAVADRFGLWGPYGAKNVSWGNFAHFVKYTGAVTSLFPSSWTVPFAWAATIAETLFGILLIAGFKIQMASVFSGLLLLSFAIGMVTGLGIKTPFDYSVFSAAAAAFLLAFWEPDRFTLDKLLNPVGRIQSFSIGDTRWCCRFVRRNASASCARLVALTFTQYSADSRNLVGTTPAGESPSRNIDVAIGHARQTRGPWHEVRTKT